MPAPLSHAAGERNGAYYCEQHYLERYTPRCDECHQIIEGRVLAAMGGSHHPGCFKVASSAH